MKKALSVLLAMALLLCVAAPAAFAASEPKLVSTPPGITTITMGQSFELAPFDEDEDVLGLMSDMQFEWTSSHPAVTITPVYDDFEGHEGPEIMTIGTKPVTVTGGQAASAYTATISCVQINHETVPPAPVLQAYPADPWEASIAVTFAPAVTGTPLSIAADKTALVVGDPFVKADATAVFTPTHTCVADFLLFWDVVGNVYPVTFRPANYVDSEPRPDNNTYGAEALIVEAKSSLTADTTVAIYAECQDCGALSNQVLLTITVEDNSDREEDSLLYILTKWWHDLKWTWDYQIHPFFKYIYFNTGGWISAAWAMLVDAIKGLFE